MRKTIGLFAHVDAGKTTLAEQLLFRAHALPRLGRVDHQDSFLDGHPLERARGITIFSDQARFQLGANEYHLVDTPGHVDFAGEMERALAVMDAAIVVVSGVEGVQSHTETVFRLLTRRGIPCLFFVNKLDREGASLSRTLAAMTGRLSPSLIDLTGWMAGGELPEGAVEELAAQDEALMARYFEGGYDRAAWLSALGRRVMAGQLYPVFGGAALTGTGVDALLMGLDALTPTGYEAAEALPFGARVYKVRHDARGERLVYLKVLSGQMSVKQALGEEKVNEIRLYSGGKYLSVQSAPAGALCAVTGLKAARPGDGLGAAARQQGSTQPALAARVLAGPDISPQRLLQAFRTLEDEEPLLQVAWDEALQQLQIQVMGAIQLEVLRELAASRFGLAVDFGPCRVLYQETIARPVDGRGHFEPLRHYAEVHLRLSPLPRGSGVRFESLCPVDELPLSYQRLIETHVFERQHRGALTGMPLTDVMVSLVSGRFHLKHTEGGDFREAVYRAIRQGLFKAEGVLLEPLYRFTLEVEEGQLGRALFDLTGMHCAFDPPECRQGRGVVTGSGPVATLMGYAQQLAAYSHGRGTLALEGAGYQPCHNAAEVIAQAGYDREADLANPADSVFCQKGAGFSVKWNLADGWMHCP